MFIRALNSIIVLLPLLLCFKGQAQNCSAPHQAQISVLAVVYDAPADTFWGTYKKAVIESAKQLGIQLEILMIKESERNRFSYMTLLKNKLQQHPKFDLILSTLFLDAEDTLLDFLDSQKIKHIIVNTSIRGNVLTLIDKPRVNKPYWLAMMTPDDIDASYKVTNQLIKLHKENSAAPPVLVALAGSHASIANQNRVIGLDKALVKNKLPRSSPIYTSWFYESGYTAADAIFKRISNIDIVWTASPSISAAVIDWLAEHNKPLPIIGSFDWSPLAIESIKSGKLKVSMGGHFMEAAYALVLAYDYFHGHDFAPELGTIIKTQLRPLTLQNLPKYETLLTQQKYDQIDFKKFSRCLNPHLKQYQFTLDTLN